MSDGIERAAAAFDSVINSDQNKGAPSKGTRNEGPPETLFKNVGELDDDSPPKGGGDEEEDGVNAKSVRRDADEGDGDGDEGRPVGDDSPGPEDEDEDAQKEEDEDEDEDTDDDDDEQSNLLGREVEVTVDGEPVKVSVKEALEGYVRTETFHRRMNQLDEAKKIVRRAAADAVSNYEYSMNVAKQMESYMEQLVPKEPNWDEEFQKDPAKARELQRYYEKVGQFKTKLKSELDEAIKKNEESSANQLRAFAEEESQKFDQMNRKNWSDPKKKAKDLQSMRKTALSTGFTEEELSQVYDSRMLTILLKASKYDRMMASRPKPVIRPTGKQIPPGSGSAKSRTANKGVSPAMKRLNRTGSIEDAAVVFDQLIKN